MEFLKRHHAVRAIPDGRPDWRKATDEALRGWADGGGPWAADAAAEIARRAIPPKPVPAGGNYDPSTDLSTLALERHVREGGD